VDSNCDGKANWCCIKGQRTDLNFIPGSVKLEFSSWSRLPSHVRVTGMSVFSFSLQIKFKTIIYTDRNPNAICFYSFHTCRCRHNTRSITKSCSFSIYRWGFYTKFCKEPIKIVGGENYCFKLDSSIKISQAILFGHPIYPFETSITHFRENFILRMKVYMADDDDLDIDAAAKFLSVGGSSWTIRGDSGEKICLNSTSIMDVHEPKSSSKRKFCLFDATNGTSYKWREIYEIHRGCAATSSVLHASSCQRIHPENGSNDINDIRNSNLNTLQTKSTLFYLFI
jgi:hypothetical protein